MGVYSMAMHQIIERKSDKADVLLLLEGTFPYVLGGVSVWVANLIQKMPEVTFAGVFLGGAEEMYPKGIQFTLPDNLVHFESHFLFDAEKDISSNKEFKVKKKGIGEHLEFIHDGFSSLRKNVPGNKCPVFGNNKEIDEILFNSQFLLKSKNSWDFILKKYNELSSEPSFIDYFWTVRNIHEPFSVLYKVLRSIPEVKLIHSPSTGYAGMLGALIHQYRGTPFITTEHGIYTRERYLELLDTSLFKLPAVIDRIDNNYSYLQMMWMNLFESFSRMSYANSNYVTSLYDAARSIQIASGSKPEKTRVIPNGINISRFKIDLESKKASAGESKVVALVGRLVRIKSTVDFITAMSVVSQKCDHVEGWVCYAGAEEQEYIDECMQLAEHLNLGEKLKFIENKAMVELLPQIDVLVLSSISEAMPLTVLEAFAGGVPVVCSNVGSCSELIFGRGEEDIAIGPAGIIVPPSQVDKLAEGIIKLTTDSSLYAACSEAGLKRVKKYYDEDMMVDAYYALYKEFL